MRSFHAHRYIENIAHAAKKTHLPVVMVSFTDHETPAYLRIPSVLRHFINPFLLIRTLQAQPKGHIILLREFLTLPMVLAIPFLLRFRERLYLVNVHNLQKAHSRFLDRAAMRFLFRMGFRFIFLESKSGLAELGIYPFPGQVLVLPLMSSHHPAPKGPIADRIKPLAGLIGDPRSEKSFTDTLDILADSIRNGELNTEILVGCSDAQVRRYANTLGFHTCDTTRNDAYKKAIRSCDAVILNYERDAYYYRTSGTILDAISLDTAVVCPNYPVFKTQVTAPCIVGATFSSNDQLAQAIEQACRIGSSSRTRFRAYVEHRSATNVASIISEHLIHYHSLYCRDIPNHSAPP